MPQNRSCDYCGDDVEPGTGTMFVHTNGSVVHYCSAKCEKNADLGREPRDLEWTEAGGKHDAREEAEAEAAAEAEEEAAAEAEAESEDTETEDVEESEDEAEETDEESETEEEADAEDDESDEDEE